MTQKISGGCHCGAVRFEADADLSQPIQCNCSHCQIKGMLLTFVPEGGFRLVSGQEKLGEYRFNKHVIAHQFCQVCGVQPFGFGKSPDGARMAAINMRCVDGIEPEELSPRKFDGRKL